MTSRNQREGWYAGWRPLLAKEGHRRSGKPSKDLDWIPYPDPLKKKIVARFKEPINVTFGGHSWMLGIDEP